MQLLPKSGDGTHTRTSCKARRFVAEEVASLSSLLQFARAALGPSGVSAVQAQSPCSVQPTLVWGAVCAGFTLTMMHSATSFQKISASGLAFQCLPIVSNAVNCAAGSAEMAIFE